MPPCHHCAFDISTGWESKKVSYLLKEGVLNRKDQSVLAGAYLISLGEEIFPICCPPQEKVPLWGHFQQLFANLSTVSIAMQISESSKNLLVVDDFSHIVDGFGPICKPLGVL